MEDIYYFSQGRLIHNVSYKKIENTKETKETKETKDKKDVNDANNKGNNLFNFKIFNASILRYR
jgi:hypothetical protein